MKKVSILIILVLAIGALFYFSQQKEPAISIDPIEVPQNLTLSFHFSEEDIIERTFAIEPDSHLIDITSYVASAEKWAFESKDYGDMGVLVTKINHKNNGEDGKYWQYFIDGKQPQISANKYFPENNAHIEWKFIKSEF